MSFLDGDVDSKSNVSGRTSSHGGRRSAKDAKAPELVTCHLCDTEQVCYKKAWGVAFDQECFGKVRCKHRALKSQSAGGSDDLVAENKKLMTMLLKQVLKVSRQAADHESVLLDTFVGPVSASEITAGIRQNRSTGAR